MSSLASSVQLNPTISIFIQPITGDFGWTRSVFAGATSIGTLLGGFAALVIGPLIDRFGAKWILLSGFFVMGGLLMALGSINALWQFYLIFIFTRLSLQGIVNLTNNVVLAKWFVVKRGRALAISSIGQRVGLGTVPLFAQLLIAGYGWRTATVGLGFLTWGLTLVPILFWLRRRPEDMGLRPDGLPPEDEQSGTGQVKQAMVRRNTEVSFTLSQALRTRSFYILLTALCISNFVNTGTNFHLFPLLIDRGFSPNQGIAIISIWSLMGIPTVALGGFLAERFPIRYLMIIGFLGLTLSVAILLRVEAVWTGFLFAVIYGTFFGASLLFQNLSFANYFGRASFGAIRGFTTPFQMTTNALGPLAAAFVFDTTNSYSIILTTYIGLLLFLAATMLLAKPPHAPDLAGPETSGRDSSLQAE
jgi:sugar phosphate permease